MSDSGPPVCARATLTPQCSMSQAAIDAAIACVPESAKRDIQFAHAQIKKFADAQRASITDIELELHPGVTAGHTNLPCDVAGCYVSRQPGERGGVRAGNDQEC